MMMVHHNETVWLLRTKRSELDSPVQHDCRKKALRTILAATPTVLYHGGGEPQLRKTTAAKLFPLENNFRSMASDELERILCYCALCLFRIVFAHPSLALTWNLHTARRASRKQVPRPRSLARPVLALPLAETPEAPSPESPRLCP